MATESATALILLVDRPATMPAWTAWAAAGLFAIAMASTALVQVPLHSRLAREHDREVARRLVTSNWVRTIAWTLRGLILA